MGGYVHDWGSSGAATPGVGGKDGFLKLSAGPSPSSPNKYRVRLVGMPYGYLQHWEPVICRSPGPDPATGQVIDPLRLGVTGQVYEPKKRYAIWVLDRDDGGKLKVMDFPPSLYDKFKEWRDAYKDEPGGQKGCDWQIKVFIPAGGTRKQTKYEAMPLDRAPFTKEEIALIKAQGDISKKLQELRRDNTPEEIRAMLAKKDGAPTESAPPAAPAAPPAPAKVAPVPESSDDDNPIPF